MVMARNRAAKEEVTKESDLLLPAYKIYEGDVRYSETPEPNSYERFFQKEFATYKGNVFIDITCLCQDLTALFLAFFSWGTLNGLFQYLEKPEDEKDV